MMKKIRYIFLGALIVMAILGLIINQINQTNKVNLGSEIYTFAEVESDHWQVTGGEYWIREYEQGYRIDEIKYMGSNTLETSEIEVEFYLDAIDEDGKEYEKTIYTYNESYDDNRTYEKDDVIIGGGATGQLPNKDYNFIFGRIYLKISYVINGNENTDTLEIPLVNQK